MSDPLLDQSTPTAFFRDLLRKALEEQRVSPSEHVEHYLVGLLERFVRSERGNWHRPLALDYLESFGRSPAVRYEKLKGVGDTALFVSGVFTESLERTTVGAEYYTSLGGLAYGHLAAHPAPVAGRSVAELFGELSARFLDYVRVLSQMSLQSLFGSDQDTIRIYRRWLLTRGARDADRLVRRGIIPFAPKNPRTH